MRADLLALYNRELEALRQLLSHYQVRTRAPFYNFSHERSAGRVTILGDPALAIPECDSSIWGGSWKRFMVDYMTDVAT